MRRRPWPILPLLVLVVALAVAAGAWLTSAPAVAPGAQAPGRGDAALPHVAVPPLEALRETVERPLFDALRRPASGVTGTADSSTLLLGRYKLLGVVEAGGTRRAMVSQTDTGRSRMLAVGEMLDDWRVEVLTQDSITFRRGTEVQSIRFGFSPRALR